MTEGEKLKTFIDNQHLSKIAIAKDLGMSRQNLFQLFKSNTLGNDTKEKFEQYFKKSIFTDDSNYTQVAIVKKKNTDVDLYKELIESMKRENAMMRKTIEEKDKRIEYLIGMLNSSASEITKQTQLNRAYLKTNLKVLERVVIHLEKKPVAVIQNYIDTLLGEAMTGAS